MAIGSTASTSLAPGFRFHPTDEELVRYYLRRKVCGKTFRFDAISDIDIYKVEPWDLPGKSRLKTRDLEWYFFSVLDKKYGNGSKTNRATERGYWKTTGKDRHVYHRSQIVGMKKTLVYHNGRAPRGERTNWVMHEYRLIDAELEKAGVIQDAFVLCRVFQKSGSGPKNGEQHGAPFIEEEWEDDEVELIPKDEVSEAVVVGDDAYLDNNDAYLDGNDLEQILGSVIPSEDAPLPLNCYAGDNNSRYVEESNEIIDGSQKLLVGAEKNHSEPLQPDDQKLFNSSVLYDMDTKPVRREYIGESSQTVNSADVDYLLDEPFLDAADNLQVDDGAFLETNDLSNPFEADPSSFDMLEEYLKFFDADGNSQYLASDSSEMMGIENLVSEQASLTQKHVDGGTQQSTVSSQQLLEHNKDVASSSMQKSKFGSDIQYPFIKKASHMLGSFPAPPAFASEFPTKDAALCLNLASQSSSSAHFTAGMIQIRDMKLTENGTDWRCGKHGNIDIVLSFGLSRVDNNSAVLEPLLGVLFGKTGSVMFRGWFYFIFIWVLILCLSFKTGAYIYAG